MGADFRSALGAIVTLFVCIVAASPVSGQTVVADRSQPACCSIIMPPGAERSSYVTNTWPNGIVPYVFDGNVNSTNQSRAIAAMAEIEAVCNVDFVPRTTQNNYIYIQDSTVNSATVGMVGGAQTVNIFNWTFKFIIAHELLHSLGFWHEQQRPDRDTYVSINFGNIQSGQSHNFNIQGTAYGAYDFDSVMHYGQCDFTNCGSCTTACRTITVLPPNQGWQNAIGQRSHLSTGDIDGLRFRYGWGLPDDFSLSTPSAFAGNVFTSGFVIFDWSNSLGAQNYRLLVDDDPAYLSPAIDVVVTPSEYIAQPGALLPNKVYFWKVTATNPEGTTASTPAQRIFSTTGPFPTILHVDSNAEFDGLGSTWSSPRQSLTDALATAVAVGPTITEIRVAQGLYLPGSVRTASFELFNGVVVRGGYAGPGAPNPDAWDPVTYATVLSGDLNGDDDLPRDKKIPGADNSLHLLFANQVTNATISGLTIIRGNANGPDIAGNGGGLIVLNGSSLTVEHCRFMENTASNVGGGAFISGSTIQFDSCVFESNAAENEGGGLRTTQSLITMNDCEFSYNTSASGGGVYHYLTASGSAATHTDCNFISNIALNDGGGVCIDSPGTTVRFNDCDFSGNAAGIGGAIRFHTGDLTLTGCNFTGNSSTLLGGAIVFRGGIIGVTDCLFANNSTDQYGGALHLAVDSVKGYTIGTFVLSRFLGNTAQLDSGAIDNESGLVIAFTCLFSGNTAGDYGGVGITYASTAQTSLRNCTLTNNSAGDEGGGVYSYPGSFISLGNSILYHNTAGLGTLQQQQAAGVGEVFNSCIEGWDGSLGGIANFGDDPLFIDPDGIDDIVGTIDDDLRVAAASLTIEAGDNNYVVLELTPTDLDGNLRIFDSDQNGNPIVDLGAYEYVGIPYFLGACCMSDGSCVNEMEEVVCENYDGIWQGGATECGAVQCSPPCPADLAAPVGVIDVFDLFVLLGNWGTAGSGAELAAPTDVVDVFDLFVLLSAWGDCL